MTALAYDSPESPILYGELMEDDKGRWIVVMFGGTEEADMAYASSRLGSLVPHFSIMKNPDGTMIRDAMRVPCSWPVVVQLAATFGSSWRAGERLTEWLRTELLARMNIEGGLTVTPPAGLTPYSWQISGARLIAATGTAYLNDEAGPQPVDTPILTTTGWTTMGRLLPGDLVYDLKGRATPIRTIKYFGERWIYRVTLSDGTSTLATDEHRWRVLTHNDRTRGTSRVRSTKGLLDYGLHRSVGKTRAANFSLPNQPVLQLDGPTPELDAYTYGALLGDGSLSGSTLSITCPDSTVLERVQWAAAGLGTTSRWARPDNRCQSLVFHRSGELRAHLDKLGALVRAGHKHIDPSYLLANEATRRALLAGLLDTDGSANAHTGSGIEYSSASAELASGVAFLARSLGAVVSELDPRPTGYRNAAGERVECQLSHRILIYFPATSPNPFYLARKAERWVAQATKAQRKQPIRTIQAIERVGSAEVCCIELDTDVEADRVYLTDTTLIPTHNTGKTATTVLGLVERAAAGEDVFPVVVVCPASVATHWVREFNTWAPWVRAVAWAGTPSKRRMMIGHHDVYVTSYETARRDAQDDTQKRSPLVHIHAKTVIADESHRIKDSTTAQTKAVLRLARKAENFVGLTGTPIAHSTKDITPTLEAMDPGAWPSSERFELRYCQLGTDDIGQTENLGLRAEMTAEFWDCLLGQYRRVAKADVLSELPPKVYTVEQVIVPPQWKAAYDAYEQDMLTTLPGDADELEAFDVLAQIQHLVQLASAPGDANIWYETVEDPETGLPIEKRHVNITLKDDPPSWKIDKLIEIMARYPGQPIATLAPSKQLMMLAGARAQSLGYRVGYIVGGQSKTARQGAIDGFQNGDLDLICVSTKAGGVGLTLTAACVAVFLQRPWSFIEASQAEDRFHRIGAEVHEKIDIYDVVAANTIESRVRAVLKERAGSFADFVRDPRILAECLGGASVTRINAPRRAS